MIFTIFVSFMLVYVIPPTWITNTPFLEALPKFIYDSIPAVRDYVAASKFPETTYVYFGIMHFLSPLGFWSVIRYPKNDKWFADNFQRAPYLNSLKIAAFILLQIGIGFVMYVHGGIQTNQAPLNESKSTLAALGFAATGYGICGLFGVYYRIYYFWRMKNV